MLDQIAELWAQDVITEEIARRLGTTKGRVCRLARDARLKGDRRFPARLHGHHGRARMAKKAPPSPPPKVNPLIQDLSPNGCKWPVRSGEERGEHYFCDELRAPGSPYCKAHRDTASSKLRGAPALQTWLSPTRIVDGGSAKEGLPPMWGKPK